MLASMLNMECLGCVMPIAAYFAISCVVSYISVNLFVKFPKGINALNEDETTVFKKLAKLDEDKDIKKGFYHYCTLYSLLTGFLVTATLLIQFGCDINISALASSILYAILGPYSLSDKIKEKVTQDGDKNKIVNTITNTHKILDSEYLKLNKSTTEDLEKQLKRDD